MSATCSRSGTCSTHAPCLRSSAYGSANFVAPDKTAAKPVEPARPVVRAPVVAGQINGANAQEKAQALRDELDRDMERAVEASEPKK